MLLSDVGVLVLVLVGFAPPISLPAESSSKVKWMMAHEKSFFLGVSQVFFWKSMILTYTLVYLQLNEVLLSNPFDRPHATIVLEVQGTKGS